jgi:hypothetical protein
MDIFPSNLMHMEILRQQTAATLPGCDLTIPSLELIFVTNVEEPPILYSVLALGSLDPMVASPFIIATRRLKVPLHAMNLYQKAIVALGCYIGAAQTPSSSKFTGTVLTAALLLYCFDILTGYEELAIRHLGCALAIIRSLHGQIPAKSSRKAGHKSLETGDMTTLGAIGQINLRIASDWLMFLQRD